MNKSPPREGELYKTISVGGHTFEVRYGYYCESERESVDPLPLFPDFAASPVFTESGQPLVSVVQPPCEHYCPKNEMHREDWCGDCRHYSDNTAEIALCNCQHNQLY